MISPEAQREGHHYANAANAHCPKCGEIWSRELGRPVISLDCDFDEDC